MKIEDIRPETLENLKPKIHFKDPLTPEERYFEDMKFLEWMHEQDVEGDVWFESAYCGTWCGAYLIGDFSGSSRYRQVGWAADGQYMHQDDY